MEIKLGNSYYEALFSQNEKARNALIATKHAKLTHSIGKRKMNETVLTQQEFCSRLTKIRTKIIASTFVEF